MTIPYPPDQGADTSGAPVEEPVSIAALTAEEQAKATELREFLIQVGNFMDLPPKRTTRVRLAGAVVASWRRRIMRRAPLVAGVLVACVLTFTLWNGRQPTLPAALVGDWTTSNPRYADRQLAFTPTEVLLGVGQAQRSRHRITRLATHERADSVELDLAYEQDGEQTELRATLINGSPARLVLAHPAGLVWERRAEGIPRSP